MLNVADSRCPNEFNAWATVLELLDFGIVYSTYYLLYLKYLLQFEAHF